MLLNNINYRHSDQYYYEPNIGDEFLHTGGILLPEHDPAGTYAATVSSTDLAGNAYSAGTQSITFSVDNIPFQISGSSISQDNLSVSLTFSEQVYTDYLSGSGSNTLETSDFSLSFWRIRYWFIWARCQIFQSPGTLIFLKYATTGFATGAETLTISIAENNIYDKAGNSALLLKDLSLNNNLIIEYDNT